MSDPAALDSVSGDSATIDWGDGGTSTRYVSVSGNIVYVSGSHSYAQQGLYQITTTLQSGGGDSETVVSTATVADAPLTVEAHTVSAVEGQLANLTLADFSDPNPNALNGDFQVSIDWGDNSGADSADAVNGTPADFSVVGSHTYAESGTYTVEVTITDDGGASVTALATVIVADAAITATGVNFSTLVDQTIGPEPVALFDDANPAAQASDFTVTIDWGNGSSSPGQLVGQDGEFAVYNDFVYQQAGSYAVTVTLSEDGQAVATASSTATIGTLQEGQSNTLTVMSFTDTNPSPPSSYTALIDWGDGTITTGTVQQSDYEQFEVQGTHAYASSGSYTPTVTMSKAGSNSLSASGSSVLVDDAPLTLWADNVSPTEGQTLTNVPVAIFVDANPLANPDEFVPTVQWGDGTAASGGTVASTGPIFTVQASHTYAKAGTDSIQVTVAQAKGVAVAFATNDAKIDWKDKETYHLDLDVALNGDWTTRLPGNVANGVEDYLPGQKGTKPAISIDEKGVFQPQTVNLYLKGVTSDVANSVTFAFAKDEGKLKIGTGNQSQYYSFKGYLDSDLPGYAGNATVKAISPGGGRTDTADYSFAKDKDLFQTTATPGKEATIVPLYVKDYGGEARIIATVVDKQGKVHTFELTVPVDSNQNGIADHWLYAQAREIGWTDELLKSFKDPNWDGATFPAMTNEDPKSNDPAHFPEPVEAAKQGVKLEVGDGLPLWYKYRGIIPDGGFALYDVEPEYSFTRLQAGAKNVLVQIDATSVVTQKLDGDANAKDTLLKWMKTVAEAYTQGMYGAGVAMYYMVGPQSGKKQPPTINVTGNEADVQKTVLTKLSNYVTNGFRGGKLRVNISQFWRQVTVVQVIKERGLPVDFSGYSNSASTLQDQRAGSFLFYDTAQNVFRTTVEKKRGKGLDFNTFVAGVIIHELAHQLIRGPGHFSDADGNGAPNQASDFASVQFNYAQPAMAIPTYKYQDYYPLPGTTFRFGHAYQLTQILRPGKFGPGTVITNMQLKDSFLPPYKDFNTRRIGG